MFQSGKLLPKPPETVGCRPHPRWDGPWACLCAHDHGSPQPGHVPAPPLPKQWCMGSLAWLLTQPEGQGGGVSLLQPSSHWA